MGEAAAVCRNPVSVAGVSSCFTPARRVLRCQVVYQLSFFSVNSELLSLMKPIVSVVEEAGEYNGKKRFIP